MIIPTLDRPSLAVAVDSVRRQAVPTRIVVVNDSGSPLTTEIGEAEIVDTTGRVGAAAARNAGFERVRTEFFALLDDDDEWLPEHLQTALGALAADDADLYFCRGLVVGASSSRIVPVVPLAGRTIGQYLFEPSVWRSRNRRILTPTVVARAALAKVAMDPALEASEDTWWLLSVEAAGARAVYRSHVGVLVQANEARDTARRTGRDVLSWARRLETVQTGAGRVSLIAQQGRDAVREGDPAAVISLALDAARLGPIVRWLPLIALQVVLSAIVEIRHTASRPKRSRS